MSSVSASSPSDDNHNYNLISHTLPHKGPIPGFFAILLILTCMSFGPISPFICLILFFYKWYISGTILLVLIITPFIITVPESPTLCRFLLLAAGWFHNSISLHVEEDAIETMKTRGALWCMHPHGTSFGYGFALNGALRFKARDNSALLPDKIVQQVSEDRLANINGVQAPVLFRIPLLRPLLHSFGCCTPATKEAMFKLFKQQADFGILPGGMEEVALYKRYHDRVYLRSRAGFIKYALQHGYTIVIAYTFGESDTYDSVQAFKQVRMFMLKKWGFVIPIFWGPYWKFGCPLLPPRSSTINTVVGGHFKLPLLTNPTNEQVKQYHELYISQLTALFDRHKAKFGYAERQLEIL